MITNEDLNQLERSTALGNFYWFAKHVFGNQDMKESTHKEICEVLQTAHRIKKRGTTEVLILMPRGTYKSSIASQAYPLWRALHDPNVRVLITNEKLDNAKSFLDSIKGCVEFNEFFGDLFGNLRDNPETGKPIRWKQESVMLNSRTNWQLREPTFSIGSPSTTKTSQHYDLIIADDLISEKTVTTPEQVRKTLQYYRQLQSLLDPGGLLIIIGTRYSYDDLYDHLLANSIPDKVIVEKAVREDGTLFFPEFNSVNEKGESVVKGLGHATLEELRTKLGSYMFGCQYLNEPTNRETAVFLQEDFKYFDASNPVPDEHIKFLLVDPARSVKQDSDYSALVIVSVDGENNYYVEYAQQIKVVPSKLIDLIYALHARFKFAKIGIERVAMQDLNAMILDRVKMGAANAFIPTVDVPTSNQISKEARIRAIEPFFKQGRVYLAKGLQDLEDQLIRFPNLVKDDLIDALSMFPRVVYGPRSLDAKKEKKIKHPDRAYIDWDEIRRKNQAEDYWEWGNDFPLA